MNSLNIHPHTDELRLKAFDEHDLTIVSAHLQNAFIQRSQLRYVPKVRRFALLAATLVASSDKAVRPNRRFAYVHFDHVRRVRTLNMNEPADTAYLELLSIAYFPATEDIDRVNNGVNKDDFLLLFFCQDRVIRLDVECLETSCHIFGEPWQVLDERDTTRPSQIPARG